MTTAFHLRDSYTQYDEDDDEDMPLVVDAGRLRWLIGVAGDDEPRCVTQNLTPWVLSPVLSVTPPLCPLVAVPVDNEMLPLAVFPSSVARPKLPLADAPAPDAI